jgi:hypothetical protein
MRLAIVKGTPHEQSNSFNGLGIDDSEWLLAPADKGTVGRTNLSPTKNRRRRTSAIQVNARRPFLHAVASESFITASPVAPVVPMRAFITLSQYLNLICFKSYTASTGTPYRARTFIKKVAVKREMNQALSLTGRSKEGVYDVESQRLRYGGGMSCVGRLLSPVLGRLCSRSGVRVAGNF